MRLACNLADLISQLITARVNINLLPRCWGTSLDQRLISRGLWNRLGKLCPATIQFWQSETALSTEVRKITGNLLGIGMGQSSEDLAAERPYHHLMWIELGSVCGDYGTRATQLFLLGPLIGHWSLICPLIGPFFPTHWSLVCPLIGHFFVKALVTSQHTQYMLLAHSLVTSLPTHWSLLCQLIGHVSAHSLVTSLPTHWSLLCLLIGDFSANSLVTSLSNHWSLLCQLIGHFSAKSLVTSLPTNWPRLSPLIGYFSANSVVTSRLLIGHISANSSVTSLSNHWSLLCQLIGHL